MLPSEDLEIAADEVMDDAVEDVVGFDVAEAAIHTLKRLLQQRPRDVHHASSWLKVLCRILHWPVWKILINLL